MWKVNGVDLIPNEILKQESMVTILYTFINICFQTKKIPSSWQRAILSPIPKSSSKDPYVPTNYRGISLLSCIYKLYSGLINARLTKYCEKYNLIVDEQNGFRSERSCLDHVFTLSTLIRNRKSKTSLHVQLLLT